MSFALSVQVFFPFVFFLAFLVFQPLPDFASRHVGRFRPGSYSGWLLSFGLLFHRHAVLVIDSLID